MTMLRTCVGKGNCSNKAEHHYLVKGFRTAFEVQSLSLCDSCPDELRAEGHQVELKPEGRP